LQYHLLCISCFNETAKWIHSVRLLLYSKQLFCFKPKTNQLLNATVSIITLIHCSCCSKHPVADTNSQLNATQYLNKDINWQNRLWILLPLHRKRRLPRRCWRLTDCVLWMKQLTSRCSMKSHRGYFINIISRFNRLPWLEKLAANKLQEIEKQWSIRRCRWHFDC